MYYWKAAIGTTQGIGTIDPSLHFWEKCLTGLSYKTVYDYHISKHDPKLWTNNFYGIRVQWDINKI